MGGVQAKDPVAVHSEELEIRRPGSWNRALVRARPSAPTRLLRYLVLAITSPALIERSRSGRVKASSSKPTLFTPPRTLPVHAPVRGLLSVSAPLRSVLQLLMFSTMKLRPLNVFSWKLRKTSWKSARFTSSPRPLYLPPTSNASLISGLNFRLSPDATMPWHPVWAGLTQIAPLPE